MIEKTKHNIYLRIILTIIFSFWCFQAFPQPQHDIEKKAKELEQSLGDTKNIDSLIKIFKGALPILDSANKEAGLMSGMKQISVKPSETPEKEAERRRDIINQQFNLAKNLLGSIPEGEENPQISQALPVEGYTIINGGEKELWYNKQTKTDVVYSIKESFVGNLIILHTYNIEKGDFEKEKDYELDTLSTNIEIRSLSGKKCIRWTPGSPAVCTLWADLSRYEIDPGEKYPQFYSNVVFASSTEGRKIKIEASSPKVVFKSSDGTAATIRCFGAQWTIAKQEFETLLKRGEIILRKDIGVKEGATQSCRSGSTMELYLKLQQVCENKEQIRLEIVSPQDKQKYLFSDEYLLDENSNSFVLNLEAKITPDKYADSIEWIIPDLDGSKKIFTPSSTSTNPKGRKVKVTYKGLPYSYKDFGKKNVIARVKVDSCTIEDKKEIQIFYPRDEKNNPEGKYPNWFYYWKQTPAARPFGQNVRIEYQCAGIPAEKCNCDQKGVIGQYNPNYSGYKTINICNLKTNTWDSDTFWVRLPSVKRSKPSTLSERNFFVYTHIDTFAVDVMHEFTHFNNSHTFWPDGWKENQDRDEDDIPDRLEPEMGFDPGKKQTYWQEFDLGGDEEFLTLESTFDYQTGTFDEYDWGKPGKNWY